MTTSHSHANDRRCVERLANLRRLAAEFQQRAMRIADVCALLTVKQTAARAYVKALGAVLEVTCGGMFEGGNVYRLIDDADVDACLVNLGKPPRKPAESKSQVSTAARAGRRFHIMQDDEPHPIRVSRTHIPQHDPILAALFGLVQPEQQS